MTDQAAKKRKVDVIEVLDSDVRIHGALTSIPAED